MNLTEEPPPNPEKLLLPGLTVVARAPADLKPNPRNARRHTREQVAQIKKAIEAFGFTVPIVIGADDEVLAGHARLEAAKAVGLSEVPTISLAHLTPQEQRMYMVTDNRLSELSTWDDLALKVELTELAAFDLEFTIADIGFNTPDLNRILFTGDDGKIDTPEEEEADLPPIAETAVSMLGDTWILGDHRLVCGDALLAESYERLMPEGEVARMVFTDAPYNVAVKGHITKRGAERREFPMATGEMSSAEFTAFLTTALRHAADHAVDGAIAYSCMDWRHMAEMLEAGQAAVGELKNLVVWAKPNAGMGAFYRSQHELVFVFKKGDGPHVNNFSLGQHGRYRTNLWQYPGGSGFHADRQGDLALHVTPKPVAMVAEAILDVSHMGEIVLDPFAGSGSTLMAAEQTGRRARVIELDPLYCDVICRRFAANGGRVVLKQTGQTFDETAAARSPNQAAVA